MLDILGPEDTVESNVWCGLPRAHAERDGKQPHACMCECARSSCMCPPGRTLKMHQGLRGCNFANVSFGFVLYFVGADSIRVAGNNGALSSQRDL